MNRKWKKKIFRWYTIYNTLITYTHKMIMLKALKCYIQTELRNEAIRKLPEVSFFYLKEAAAASKFVPTKTFLLQ